MAGVYIVSSDINDRHIRGVLTVSLSISLGILSHVWHPIDCRVCKHSTHYNTKEATTCHDTRWLAFVFNVDI